MVLATTRPASPVNVPQSAIQRESASQLPLSIQSQAPAISPAWVLALRVWARFLSWRGFGDGIGFTISVETPEGDDSGAELRVTVSVVTSCVGDASGLRLTFRRC